MAKPISTPSLSRPIHSAISDDSLTRDLHQTQPDQTDYDNMTDEEILAMWGDAEVTDKYAVQHLAPDGMVYQWARCEVFGKGDYDRPAEMERMGWRAVPASRHVGRFMPADHTGPIEMDGMRLYELPQRLVRLKREAEARKARGAVYDMNEQLIYTPPGTGPRATHQFTAPKISNTSGAAPMGRAKDGALELVIE